MSQVRRFDHIRITVADLDAVTAFFVGLGLEVEGRTFVEGEFLETVIGIPDSRTEIVMLRPPDGGTRLELSGFVRPDHEPVADRHGERARAAQPGQLAISASQLGAGSSRPWASGRRPATRCASGVPGARAGRGIGCGGPRGRVTDLAASAGYADHPHLSRERVRLTGVTPRELLGGRPTVAGAEGEGFEPPGTESLPPQRFSRPSP